MSSFDLIIEPDPSDPEAAEVLVDAMVDDRKYRFVLDTGSAVVTIASDDYTSKFESLGTRSSAGVFAPKTDDLIRVSRIKLGPIERTDYTVARLEAGANVRNLIGMDLLKDLVLHFLFSESRVEVDAASHDRIAAHSLILGAAFHPYVEVSLGEQSTAAVWDTGAGITVVDSAFIEANPQHFQSQGWSEGTDSSGSQMRTEMFLMSGAQIGGQKFPPHRVASVDLSFVNSTTEIPMSSILGYSTLCKANWVFDFNRRRWGISEMLTGK